jgi:hypothetical protein
MAPTHRSRAAAANRPFVRMVASGGRDVTGAFPHLFFRRWSTGHPHPGRRDYTLPFFFSPSSSTLCSQPTDIRASAYTHSFHILSFFAPTLCIPPIYTSCFVSLPCKVVVFFSFRIFRLRETERERQ